MYPTKRQTLRRPRKLFYGIRAIRSADSVYGPGAMWLRKASTHNILLFDSLEQALDEAQRYRTHTTSLNMTYYVDEYHGQ